VWIVFVTLFPTTPSEYRALIAANAMLELGLLSLLGTLSGLGIGTISYLLHIRLGCRKMPILIGGLVGYMTFPMATFPIAIWALDVIVHLTPISLDPIVAVTMLFKHAALISLGLTGSALGGALFGLLYQPVARFFAWRG
jgi:hypothetical protein